MEQCLVDRPLIRIGARNWDHLTPLALGDVRPDSFDVEVVRSDTTPVLAERPDLHAAESSLSRAVLNAALGDRSFIVLPAFIYSGFRHRCVLTRRDSDLVDLSQLRGRRVGMTGWPDTGNTWTRALVREAGVAIEEVEWVVGALSEPGPGNGLGPYGVPANVTELPDQTTLVEELLRGNLDAVMTPTMPPGFHEPDSPLRRVLPDYRTAELQYFGRVGFVPGIHVITLRRDVAEAYPEVTAELLSVLRRSQQAWLARRIELLDTTPWLLDQVELVASTLGLGWSPYDAAPNPAMVAGLCHELTEQGISQVELDPSRVLSDFAELTSPAPVAG
jgi:4,5-dihydroxyphthalate decarboxylase